MEDSRIEFVKQWYRRSNDAFDDFEKFIFLWLCMVCIAKFWVSENSGLKRDFDSSKDDGKFITDYFSSRDNAERIVNSVYSLKEFRDLVSRKSNSGDYILGADKSSNPKFRDLFNHFRYNSHMGENDISYTIGKVLKSIRNTLFHGGKLYDSTNDKELLAYATPILEAIIISSAKTHMRVNLENLDYE